MNYSFKMEFKDDGKPKQMTWRVFRPALKSDPGGLFTLQQEARKKNENRDFEQFFFSKKRVSMIWIMKCRELFSRFGN